MSQPQDSMQTSPTRKMTEEEKEDLFDSIIMLQRKEIVNAKPAADVFAEIERSKGVSS